MKLKKIRSAPCGASRTCSECPSLYCPRRSPYADENDFEIVSDFEYGPETASGIAIDIGTTTVAAVRYDNGAMTGRITELNAQKEWGADVLSRIDSAVKGSGAAQTEAIRSQIDRMVNALGGGKTVIAANTTMVSLLMGWDCSGLCAYPFTAYSLDEAVYKNGKVIGGIGAFVGGDITSGLYMCGFDESDDINLFIDLGTNGEIAIGNRKSILCTSTAAGPAFEGGRISCGTGSVEGAICSVSLEDGVIETIGADEPVGICGTGIVELLYELKKAGYIDDTGLFADRYEGGYSITDGVVFTQNDVREIQTAKAAIRAGIEILIREYGASDEDIKNVYIAGGFGRRLDIEKACGIGLLPGRFAGRYRTVGNSSLGGAVKYLECGGIGAEMIRAAAKDMSLAEINGFSGKFLEYMAL